MIEIKSAGAHYGLFEDGGLLTTFDSFDAASAYALALFEHYRFGAWDAAQAFRKRLGRDGKPTLAELGVQVTRCPVLDAQGSMRP